MQIGEKRTSIKYKYPSGVIYGNRCIRTSPIKINDAISNTVTHYLLTKRKIPLCLAGILIL